MYNNLPDNLKEAIELLWKNADDAYTSFWSKEELEEEGYECSTEIGIKFEFVFPFKRED